MKTFLSPRLGRLIHLRLAEADRDSTEPMHWMPVPFPGLSYSQLEALMSEVDRRPFTTSPRLRRRAALPACKGLREKPSDDREPGNPLQWMPTPPPVISLEQLKARVEAFG